MIRCQVNSARVALAGPFWDTGPMDRRHWLLLGAALACVAGLLLWVGELDLSLDESLTPASPSPAPPPLSRQR